MTEETPQVIPHNIEAERAVLGSLLLNETVFFRVNPIVSASDFFRDAHRKLFAAITTISARGEHADLVTIKAEMGDEAVKRIGGTAYVTALASDIPDIANVERYAQIVAREAKRRRLIAMANDLAKRAAQDDGDPETLAAEAMTALTPAATRLDAQARPFVEVIQSAYAQAEKRRTEDRALALRTGFYELDSFGVLRRTFAVCGSPSKNGKSAFMKDLAVGLAENGQTAAVFSLESTPEEISWRYTSSTTGIPHGKVQDWRYLGAADFDRLARSASLAKRLPIFITRSVRTLVGIDAEARRIKAVHGLDAILIDYIQLIRHPGGPRDREERIAEISATLLSLALELDILVFATSQVNKDWMERDQRRLFPSDLKYAAAIGEAARVVLLFHRPHVYDAEQRSCYVPFQVAAANEGRTGDYEAHFDEVTQLFRDGDCAANNCRRLRNEPEESRLFA